MVASDHRQCSTQTETPSKWRGFSFQRAVEFAEVTLPIAAAFIMQNGASDACKIADRCRRSTRLGNL